MKGNKKTFSQQLASIGGIAGAIIGYSIGASDPELEAGLLLFIGGFIGAFAGKIVADTLSVAAQILFALIGIGIILLRANSFLNLFET